MEESVESKDPVLRNMVQNQRYIGLPWITHRLIFQLSDHAETLSREK